MNLISFIKFTSILFFIVYLFFLKKKQKFLSLVLFLISILIIFLFEQIYYFKENITSGPLPSYKSAWNPNAIYNTGDLVTDQTNFYQFLSTNNSGSNPMNDKVRWKLIPTLTSTNTPTLNYGDFAFQTDVNNVIHIVQCQTTKCSTSP